MKAHYLDVMLDTLQNIDGELVPEVGLLFGEFDEESRQVLPILRSTFQEGCISVGPAIADGLREELWPLAQSAESQNWPAK